MSEEEVRVEFDWSATTPATAVLETVGELTGQPAESLPPLTDAVDSEALNELFAGGADGVEVAFRYAGHRITVRSDGTLVPEPDW